MRPSWLPLSFLAVVLLGGCPGNLTIEFPDGSSIGIPLPGSRTVQLEVFNDTAFEVNPRIRFDDDSSWLAAAFPSEELSTGILSPGELVRFNMDCDELGLVFSDQAGQFLFTATIGQAEQTRILKRDDDFDCGDTIQFQFIGQGDGFGVIVSVNNVVVD